MNVIGWISQPAAIYAALGVIAAAAAVLALLQRLNFRALERHLLARQAEAEQALATLRRELGKLTEDLDGLEQAAASTPGPAPRAGMNLSKRAHALRMHRRGEGLEQIAAALSVPRQEVELLLKVHRILVAGL
jgi:hypothetical protein